MICKLTYSIFIKEDFKFVNYTQQFLKKMITKPLLITFFTFLFLQIISGQNKIPDSIENKSFEEIKMLFFETESDYDVSNTYAKSYLLKAKKSKDTFRIAQGYKYLSYISSDTTAMKYVDSIIFVTENFKNDVYPAFGYYLKGAWLCNIGKDKLGFDNYLIAKEFAERQKNESILNDINIAIATLKLDWGEYKEPLKTFEDFYKKIKSDKNYLEKYKDDYLILLHNLGIAYTRNKKYTKAELIILEGIEESNRINDNEWKNQFVFNLSINQFFEKKYNLALKNLKISELYLNDVSLGINYYYQGSIYKNNKDVKKSIYYFDKSDSIYSTTKEGYSELREVYSALLNYSKFIGDSEKQYDYLNKFLEVDSLLDSREQKLNTDILINYDIPKFKAERDHLKEIITNQTKKKNHAYLITITVFIFSTLIGYYLYSRQKLYKKRFEEILKDKNTISNSTDKTPRSKKEELNISKTIIDDILIKLEKFESSKEYTRTGVTLNSLSMELKTNSSYLSKIINHYKDKSFSQYINHHRINYITSELKTRNELRKYTIAAIANEAGFNNAESFSKAFYKENGIYPSFFIKKLNQINKKNSLDL